MSKIKTYENKDKLQFRKWTSSKQKLNFVGHLIILLDITDAKGKRSRQIGESTQANMQKRFEIAFDEAYLNAVYKHFQYTGTPILDSKNANVKELIFKAEVVKWNIRYYNENTEHDSGNKIKVVTINKKRFTQYSRNGNIISVEPYEKVSNKKISELLDERSGSRVTEKEQKVLDKNYFTKPRKNKKYL